MGVLQCITKGVDHMAHISFRVSDDEKAAIESYAKLQGLSTSEVVKDAFFEKLEDMFDLKKIEEYENVKDGKTYTHDEVGKLLGIK